MISPSDPQFLEKLARKLIEAKMAPGEKGLPATSSKAIGRTKKRPSAPPNVRTSAPPDASKAAEH